MKECLGYKIKIVFWFLFMVACALMILSSCHYLIGMEPTRLTYDKDWRDEYIIPDDYDRNLPRDENEAPINVDRYGVCHEHTARTRIRYRGGRPTEVEPRGDLRNLDWRLKTIKGLKAIDCNMRDGNYSGTTFIGCDLTGSDLSGGTFVETVFINCTLNNVKIHTDKMFFKVKIINCKAREMKLGGTKINTCTIKDTDLTASDLSKIQITGNYFIKCNLDKVLMNSSLINDTLFDSIGKTEGLSLEKSTVTGCSFITMLFNRVSLVDTVFSSGSRGNYINQCVFVFSDFKDMVLDDTVVSDSYLTFPWNSEWKFNDGVGAAYWTYFASITPTVNSIKYVFIPLPVLNLAAVCVSAGEKSYNNQATMSGYYTARERFQDSEPPITAIPNHTNCLNVNTIKSAAGSKFINLYGLSDDMEERLESLGGLLRMEKPTGLSPLGILDLINSMSTSAERERTRADEEGRKEEARKRLSGEKKELQELVNQKEITNNELTRKLDRAYGYIRGASGANTEGQS